LDAACNTVMGEAARQPTTCLARHLDAEVSGSWYLGGAAP
jgi:hypothetical protein